MDTNQHNAYDGVFYRALDVLVRIYDRLLLDRPYGLSRLIFHPYVRNYRRLSPLLLSSEL